MFSVKGQIVDILDFAGCTVSVVNPQLYSCNPKAVLLDTMKMSELINVTSFMKIGSGQDLAPIADPCYKEHPHAQNGNTNRECR